MIDPIPDSETRGIQCPKCHCVRTEVVKTRPGYNSKGRQRKCLNCGEKFATREDHVKPVKLAIVS